MVCDNVRGGNERLFLCISSICKPDPGVDSEAIIKEDRGEKRESPPA